MRKPHTCNLDFDEYYKSTIIWIRKHKSSYTFTYIHLLIPLHVYKQIRFQPILKLRLHFVTI